MTIPRTVEKRKRHQITGEAQVQILVEGFENEPDEGRGPNIGANCIEFEHRVMLNGGHLIYAKINDPYYNLVDQLVGRGGNKFKGTYLEISRQRPIRIRTVLFWNPLKTGLVAEPVVTYVASLSVNGGGAQGAYVELIALDPTTYALSKGDADGGVYEGNVKEVIEQVCNKYGINHIDVRAKTTDSMSNKWWMMRQDPKSFIMSLLEWSTSITETKTQWMVVTDSTARGAQGRQGEKWITVHEQNNVKPIRRCVYRHKGAGVDVGRGHGDVIDWQVLGDNMMLVTETAIVTQGISAISGAYWDIVVDNAQTQVYAQDNTTVHKYLAKTSDRNAPTKPKEEANGGRTAYPSIPEFSAGDMGLKYEDYIDGYARNTYLNLNNNLFKCSLKIPGHHIWAGGYGLGVDYIYLDWKNIDGEPYWMDGNWIVYGFHHKLSRSLGWHTELYLARLDWDAFGHRVGQPENIPGQPGQ